MEYMTVMEIPNTANSSLLKLFAYKEPKLAKMSNYQIKYVEQSGTKLADIFQRKIQPKRCTRDDCYVCEIHKKRLLKGNSGCKKTGVVYRATCTECSGDDTDKSRVQECYIGETSRSLYERTSEHRSGALNIENNNFIVKHWASRHRDLPEPPEFKFEVIRRFPDAMSRLVFESVKIESEGTLNSKSEWRGSVKTRLKVEEPKWIQNKREMLEEIEKKEETRIIEELRAKYANKKKKPKGMKICQRDWRIKETDNRRRGHTIVGSRMHTLRMHPLLGAVQ